MKYEVMNIEIIPRNKITFIIKPLLKLIISLYNIPGDSEVSVALIKIVIKYLHYITLLTFFWP